MTIENTGRVVFNGAVRAQSFQTSSSARFKDDVQTLTGVPEALASLRGVRFAWKETGEPDIGLIAEEVAQVFPELVQRDAETGAVESVNYPALVAVLIEGFKEQQEALTAYQVRVAALEQQQSEMVALKAQIMEIERLLAGHLPALAQR